MDELGTGGGHLKATLARGGSQDQPVKAPRAGGALAPTMNVASANNGENHVNHVPVPTLDPACRRIGGSLRLLGWVGIRLRSRTPDAGRLGDRGPTVRTD